MSNLALRLKRLWVDWCEHNKPDDSSSPWPAEAFLHWASRELRTELIALLGDDAQCTLLTELAPQVQHWPIPVPEHEHPTNPENTAPGTEPPEEPGSSPRSTASTNRLALLGGRVDKLVHLKNAADDRIDLTAKGEVKAKTFLDLLYMPRDFFRTTWFELRCENEDFNLAALQQVYVTSITVGLEEQLLEPCPLLLFTGRQNEGLMHMKAAGPGSKIRVQLRNDSTHDLAVELRLHGVEPVKESETA